MPDRDLLREILQRSGEHLLLVAIAIALALLIALPLGYWRGIMTAESALDGTIAFWQSLIAGITVTSVLVFARLYHTLRKQRSIA